MPSNTEIANFFTPITNQIDGASYVCLNINGSNLSTPNVIQPYVTVNNRGGQPAMFVKIFGLQEFVTANAPSGGSYVLPIASSTVLGGIKVGTGLSIAGDGTLSATGGGGGVSSVGLSAPTGFSVSNSPITTSGTIALSFASGYSLPSDSVQATWTAKQDALSGTGIVKSTAGVISYISGTSAQYIAGDGTLVTFPTIPSGTVTSVGISMPSAFNVASSPITGAGTIAITGAGTSAQYIRGDGTLATYNPSAGGGGASQVFYFNGGVPSTVGGYQQMSVIANTGASADFVINADGYIASFLTDVGTPNQLNIPAGNWNFEIYFSSSSTGGSPRFYVELYKYDGSFTLISSSVANPEYITNGTAVDLYTTALSVPATTLLSTDRLAVRVYVIHSSKTITMHTQDSNLSEVITTFSTGITALNGLTAQVQTFGNDTNVTMVSLGTIHTLTWVGTLADSRIASASDWNTAYTNRITSLTTTGSGAATLISNVLNIPTPASATFVSLTTTGSSGSATLSGGVLNVPTYTLTGLGGQPLATNLTSLSGLTYASASFVKMTAAGTFALDTNTYITGNQTITLSGEASGSGTTAISVTLTNSAVIGKVLTGYTSGAGVVVATDTILQAIQKLNGNIDTVNIIIITSVSIDTNTLDANSVGQNGRNVMINNGATAINITCEASSATNFCASYTKLGSTAITFIAGIGATLTTVDGTAVLNGAIGSTACLTRTGNIFYLQISNR